MQMGFGKGPLTESKDCMVFLHKPPMSTGGNPDLDTERLCKHMSSRAWLPKTYVSGVL